MSLGWAFNISRILIGDITLHDLLEAGVQNTTDLHVTPPFLIFLNAVGSSTSDQTLQLLSSRVSFDLSLKAETKSARKTSASAERVSPAPVIYTRSSHTHSRNTKSHTCSRGPAKKKEKKDPDDMISNTEIKNGIELLKD